MIVVMMSDEDGADVTDVDPGFCEAACDPVAGIDDITYAIYDKKIRGLRSTRPGGTARDRAERDQMCPLLRSGSRSSGLRRSGTDARSSDKPED